jgi:hypothetical protein
MVSKSLPQALESLTDRQLVSWATKFGGWTYFYSNDQLRDPQGGLTTAGNWDRIGTNRRNQIIKSMSGRVTAAQLAEIRI